MNFNIYILFIIIDVKTFVLLENMAIIVNQNVVVKMKVHAVQRQVNVSVLQDGR